MAFSLHFVFYLILYISALVANKRVHLLYVYRFSASRDHQSAKIVARISIEDTTELRYSL